MSRFIGSLGLATLLLLSACGGGGGGGTTPGPGPSVRYTLSGRVLDGAGSPISGARVLLSLNDTSTDAQGRFSYGNLPAGSYVVSVADANGNYDSQRLQLGATSGEFSFELPASGGFRVQGTSPALNDNGFPLDGAIELEFSQAPDAASVSADDFEITPSVGELQLQLNGSTLRILPERQLPPGQTMLIEYSGQISSGGQDMSQPLRLRFATDSSDQYPPRLVDSRPAAGATGYAPNLAVSLEYNEELDTDTSSLTIDVQPATPVTLRVSGSSVLVSPTGGWQVNTDYTLELAGVRDASGNQANLPSMLQFRTGSQPASSRDREADWNLTTDSIVFSSNINGGYDIFSIRPDGSELTQLTALSGDERHPTLSSDGSLLAFQKRDADGNQQIWLLAMDDLGAEPVQLTSSGYSSIEPYFSRTLSNDIVFTSTRQSVTGLWRVSPDNLLETELDELFGSGQSQPRYHPLIDGQLLFQSGRSGNGDIWRKTISVISGETININLTQQLSSDEHSPAWSPDASFIVFISDFDGHENLWSADAAGDLQTQLTYLETDLSDPVVDPVSANNRCLVTMEQGSAGSDLVLVDLTSGEILANLTGV
ncbi:MAG: Ig-like domain-containing protein [bacterium]